MRSFHFSLLWMLAGFLLCGTAWAQSFNMQTVAGPDEIVSARYFRQWKDCRDELKRRDDPEDTVLVCEKLAHAADQLPSDSHFLTRRSAYVLYSTALTQVHAYRDATKLGDKAVAIILQRHDDSSGASAAYFSRGHARGLAGDLAGANADLDAAEANERKALLAASDIFERVEYATTLKQQLAFHSQVLEAMHQTEAAQLKGDEADSSECWIGGVASRVPQNLCSEQVDSALR